MNYKDYSKEDIAEMQRVVYNKIKFMLSQSYPDIKCTINVWEHFDYNSGSGGQTPTFKIRGHAKEDGPRIIDGFHHPLRHAHFEYNFEDITILREKDCY